MAQNRRRGRRWRRWRRTGIDWEAVRALTLAVVVAALAGYTIKRG